MSKIFFVTGKSCTGKDTIFSILKDNSRLNLKTVVGYTTRPMRVGEQDGVEYFFVDEDKLNKLKDENKVIECRQYNTVHGIWNYFSVNDGQIDLKNGNYIYIGTLESYEKFVEYFGEEVVYPIYVEVESGERLARAVMRERKQDEPKYKELCRRFIADEEDFSEDKILKAGIKKRYENNVLEECVEAIEKDILKECSK
ncbi:MAG: guanylate kinase [Lachnospiraceae bacterium]|nr:guanylate kinase [Lachnospiraceae bacterium]